MAQSRLARRVLTASLCGVLFGGGIVYAQRSGEDRKPSLSLRATPVAGFAPLRVRVTVDLRGGADDYQDLYCAGVEWDWGDDLKSGNSEDCAPYVAGTSEIRRRYSAEHVYRYEGTYKLTLRLKQRDRVVASGSATVEVRPGLRDGFD